MSGFSVSFSNILSGFNFHGLKTSSGLSVHRFSFPLVYSNESPGHPGLLVFPAIRLDDFLFHLFYFPPWSYRNTAFQIISFLRGATSLWVGLFLDGSEICLANNVSCDFLKFISLVEIFLFRYQYGSVPESQRLGLMVIYRITLWIWSSCCSLDSVKIRTILF